MEPVAELLGWHERRRLAGKDKEGHLEGIFGIVVIAEYAAADAQDHGPVAMDHRLKDDFLPPFHETIQQFLIRSSSQDRDIEERLEITD